MLVAIMIQQSIPESTELLWAQEIDTVIPFRSFKTRTIAIGFLKENESLRVVVQLLPIQRLLPQTTVALFRLLDFTVGTFVYRKWYLDSLRAPAK